MGQLLIRRFDDAMKEMLRARAQRHGRSMEAEARLILSTELQRPAPEPSGLGSAIAALFRDIEENREPFAPPPQKPWRPVAFD